MIENHDVPKNGMRGEEETIYDHESKSFQNEGEEGRTRGYGCISNRHGKVNEEACSRLSPIKSR